MADEEQVTAPVNADAAPAVTEGEDPKGEATTETSDAAGNPAEGEPEKKPELTPEQKKIANLEYKNRQIRRDYNRIVRLLEKQAQPPQKADDPGKPPQLADFGTVEEYVQAAVEYNNTAQKAVAAKTKEVQTPEVSPDVQEAFEDLMETGLEKYEDFQDKVFAENIRITVPMRDAVFELDDVGVQADVLYHLASHPKEANRIAKLSPLRQAAEIGKLELKITSKPAAKRPSAAPAPVSPVGGGKTPSDEIQPTEDYESFVKKRNKQLGRT